MDIRNFFNLLNQGQSDEKKFGLTGDYDADVKILLDLPLESLDVMKKVDTTLNDILNRPSFWQQKVSHTYGADVTSLKPKDESFEEQYRYLSTAVDPFLQVRKGRVDAVMVMLQRKKIIRGIDELADEAVYSGNVLILELLKERKCLPDLAGIKRAIKYGHLGVLEWMEKECILGDYLAPEGYSSNKDNDDEVNSDELGNDDEEEEVADNDEVGQAKFYQNIGVPHPMCTNDDDGGGVCEDNEVEEEIDDYGNNQEFADLAVKYGHLHILKWLVKRGSEPSEQGLLEAVKRGDLEMLKFIHPNILIDVSRVSFVATKWGHLHILKWMIIENDRIVPTDITSNERQHLRLTANNAAKNDHIPILEWLESEYKILPTRQTLKYMHSCDPETLEWMASRGIKESTKTKEPKARYKLNHLG